MSIQTKLNITNSMISISTPLPPGIRSLVLDTRMDMQLWHLPIQICLGLCDAWKRNVDLWCLQEIGH